MSKSQRRTHDAFSPKKPIKSSFTLKHCEPQKSHSKFEGYVKRDLKPEHENWIASWLDAVQNGQATMSQRARSSVEVHGGIDEITKAARSRGIHLVELTDDKGRKLIAASKHPFKTLC